MPQIFKVIETIVLPDGSELADAAEALQLLSDVPFSLAWAGSSTDSVSVVKLTRFAPAETEEQEPPPTEQADTEGTEEVQPGFTRPQPKHKRMAPRPRSPTHAPPAELVKRAREEADVEQSDTSWHSSGWRSSWWQKGTGSCHVCGKPRSEHAGKKFCDVRAAKR